MARVLRVAFKTAVKSGILSSTNCALKAPFYRFQNHAFKTQLFMPILVGVIYVLLVKHVLKVAFFMANTPFFLAIIDLFGLP